MANEQINLTLRLQADAAKKQLDNLNRAVQSISNTKINLQAPESLGRAVSDVRQLATGYENARSAIAATVSEHKKVGAALALSGDTTSSAYKSAVEEIKRGTDELKRMDAALDAVNKSAGETPKKFAGFVEFQALKQTVVDVAAAFQQFTGPFLEFDKQLKNIGTLGVKNFDDFRNAAIDLAASVPDTVAGVTEGIYNAISAGAIEVVDGVANVAEGMKFVESASRLAVAGLTTTNDSIKSLASVTNAYGPAVLSVAQASDFLFATVKNGVTTVPELNAALSNVVPIAAAAGVGFDQVSAAIATLTKQGTPTAQATTQIRQAISELLSPGAKLARVMRDAGVSTESLKSEGLAVSLDKIRAAAEKTGSSVFEAFGSIEAKQAVLALTGENAQKAAGDLLAIRDSVGSVDAAFETANQGIGVRVQGILNQIEAVAFKAFGAVGDGAVVAIEAVNKLAPVVGSLAGLQQLIPKNMFANITASAQSAGSAVVQSFQRAAGGSIISFSGIATAARAAWTAVTGPVGLAVAGITAIGVAVAAAYKYWDDFRITVDAVWGAIKSLGDDVVPLLREVGGVVIDFVKLPFEAIVGIVSGIAGLIKSWLPETKNAGSELFSVKSVLEAVRGVVDIIRSSVAGISDAFSAVKNSVSGAFDSLLKGDISGAFSKIGSSAKEVGEAFSSGFDLKQLQIQFDRDFGKLESISQKYIDRINQLKKDGLTAEEVVIAEGVLARQLKAENEAADKLAARVRQAFGIIGDTAEQQAVSIAKLPQAQRAALNKQLAEIDSFNKSARSKYDLQLSELRATNQKQADAISPKIAPQIDPKKAAKTKEEIAKFVAGTNVELGKLAELQFEVSANSIAEAQAILQGAISGIETLEATVSITAELAEQQVDEQVRRLNQRAEESLRSAQSDLGKLVAEGVISQSKSAELLAERRAAIESRTSAEIAKIRTESQRKTLETQLALEEKFVGDMARLGNMDIAEASARLQVVADKRKETQRQVLQAAGQSEGVIVQVLEGIDRKTVATINNLARTEEERLLGLAKLRADYAADVESIGERELNSRLAGYDIETQKQRIALAEQLDNLRVSEEEKSAIIEEFEARRQSARLAIIDAAAQSELQVVGDTLGAMAALFRENTLAFKLLAIAEATISAYLAFSKSLAQGGFLGIAQATIALATGLANVAKIAGVGFQSGGFTPDGAPNQVVGVVHAGEYVVNAPRLRADKEFFRHYHSGGLDYAIDKRIVTASDMSTMVIDTRSELRDLRRSIDRQTQLVHADLESLTSVAAVPRRPAQIQNYVTASVPPTVVNIRNNRIY